jgi:hypothetical protein
MSRAALALIAILLASGPALAATRVPGDTMVYMHREGGPQPQTIKTAPLPTLNFTIMGVLQREIYEMDFDNPSNVLWAIDGVTHEVGRIDVATGVFTVISTLNPPLAVDDAVIGFTFDPTSSTVYFAILNLVQAPFSSSLRTVNLVTGAQALVGSLPTGTVGLAIDNAGQMYGLDFLADRLVRIDKATAAITAVGPLGINLAILPQGLDFDSSDGTLYGCIVTNSPQVGNLVRVDTVTGAATVLDSAPDWSVCSVDVPAVPSVSQTAIALAVDASGNGVIEPGEPAVTVAPSWRNNATAATLTGAASSFTGPTGPTYTIADGAAAYGLVGQGAVSSCTSTGNCYALGVAAATRPVQHWDSTFVETIAPGGAAKTWRLHVGDSFSDLPRTNPFYRFVETLLHNSVTGGCSATAYCPASATTREQMAVFVLVAREGAGYVPPACTTPSFGDVPAAHPFCRWIEELLRRGVVGGCGGGNYCPSSPVTRDAMAVFTLRTLAPALAPPACGTPRFPDVPASSPFCPWVEELARRGVVTGCGGGNYCPASAVTREQMGVFLSVTFALSLYGA